MVHGAEQRRPKPSAPLAAFTVKHELVRFLRGMEAADPAVADVAIPPEKLIVFRVRDACTTFANMPITGRDVLDGKAWEA